MSRLFVVSAPSGAGKTTLCARLLQDLRERLVLSISSTTRAPRGEEQHGREYYFLSREDFRRDIDAGLFAEWADVHDNYYGTSREVIDDAFAEGKHVLLDIDVQGAESLRKAYPRECYTIFISPPSLEVLEQRLRSRATDSEETIQKRVRNARREMAEKAKFDSVIVNDTRERAYLELKAVVLREMKAG